MSFKTEVFLLHYVMNSLPGGNSWLCQFGMVQFSVLCVHFWWRCVEANTDCNGLVYSAWCWVCVVSL